MCLSGKVFLENMFKISYVYVDFFALRLPKTSPFARAMRVLTLAHIYLRRPKVVKDKCEVPG